MHEFSFFEESIDQSDTRAGLPMGNQTPKGDSVGKRGRTTRTADILSG
jgi:hypothetical protein